MDEDEKYLLKIVEKDHKIKMNFKEPFLRNN